MMQSKPRREGFELSRTPEDAYREMVDATIFRSCAALITHNGSEVIPPTERPSINDGPEAAPLNDLEQAAFNEIAANYSQTTPDVSYPTVPTFATIEDPAPTEINTDFDLTDKSQHDYAEFLGAK